MKSALSLPVSRFTTPGETNYYYSFIFLPSEKRRAIEAVYAFARRGDDIVDENLARDQAATGIKLYRQALDQCFAAASGAVKPPRSPQLEALSEAVRRYSIPRTYFDDLILGLEMDLNGSSYETFEELSLYAYRVAGTIGLIAIEIFGYHNPRTRDYALNLGTALQLVNIVRDLQSDAQRGRLYVPREELCRFQVTADDLAEGHYGERVVELVRFQCDRAAHYFELARQSLCREDRRAMMPAEIMAAIYYRLLRTIRKRHYNVFGATLRLSRAVKLWTALSVYLGAEWHR